jgi:hypothetical protein
MSLGLCLPTSQRTAVPSFATAGESNSTGPDATVDDPIQLALMQQLTSPIQLGLMQQLTSPIQLALMQQLTIQFNWPSSNSRRISALLHGSWRTLKSEDILSDHSDYNYVNGYWTTGFDIRTFNLWARVRTPEVAEVNQNMLITERYRVPYLGYGKRASCVLSRHKTK